MKIKSRGNTSITALLVAMTISLISLAGIMTIYLQHKQTIDANRHGLHKIFTQANTGIEILHQQLVQSGFRLAPSNQLMPSIQQVFGQSAISGSLSSINYRFQGDGSLINCEGTVISANTVSINTLTHSGEQLKCNDQVLLNNVHTFKVQFGEDTDNDKIPNRFVSSTQPGLDFEQVTAIRLGFIFKGSGPTFQINQEQTHTLLGESITNNDRFLYWPYVTTIYLRNIKP